MLAYRSNSGLSGNAGKMLGTMPSWICFAMFSSVPIRSFSAVTRLTSCTYSTVLWLRSAKLSASTSISSPVR